MDCFEPKHVGESYFKLMQFKYPPTVSELCWSFMNDITCNARNMYDIKWAHMFTATPEIPIYK
jgi:hypothetical protein